MSAKFTVEKGELRIGLDTLVDALSKKDRNELAKQLAADEWLFKAVLECVTDDSKYAGHYFKDDEDGEWWFSHRTVLEMREKLIPLMPEIARLATEEALRQRDNEQYDKERHIAWAYKLYHAWPDEFFSRRPHGPEGFDTEAPRTVERYRAALQRIADTEEINGNVLIARAALEAVK